MTWSPLRENQSEEAVTLDTPLTGIRLVNLRETSQAYPSQWEAETDDGHVVYIRYRNGQLTIGFGATVELASTSLRFYKSCGDQRDGYMTWESVEMHTGLRLKGSGT